MNSVLVGARHVQGHYQDFNLNLMVKGPVQAQSPGLSLDEIPRYTLRSLVGCPAGNAPLEAKPFYAYLIKTKILFK